MDKIAITESNKLTQNTFAMLNKGLLESIIEELKMSVNGMIFHKR